VFCRLFSLAVLTGARVQVAGADVHAMAGLLKLWLRELSDPLIPYDL
jgi:hypothetical protein